MIYILIAAAVFAADRVSKILITKKIKEEDYVEVVKDTVDFTNVKNSGAAYGLMSKHRQLLMWSTVYSAVRLAFIYRKFIKKDGGMAYKLSCALVSGGAAGNVYDRVTRKAVTDFIAFRKGFLKNIVFNLADVFIVAGALIFAGKFIASALGKGQHEKVS